MIFDGVVARSFSRNLGPRSSVAEHFLGKEEVASSILAVGSIAGCNRGLFVARSSHRRECPVNLLSCRVVPSRFVTSVYRSIPRGYGLGRPRKGRGGVHVLALEIGGLSKGFASLLGN